MKRNRSVAIIVAGGSGSRMQSDIPKQYLKLNGRPVLYYSLKIFEDSFVDDIILVVSEDWKDYCRKEIVEKYKFKKVSSVVSGGKERYDSVYKGLCVAGDCDYIYIHDGARPFLDKAILSRAKECVEKFHACAAGMPVKDTIKIVSDNGFVKDTPPRKYVWQIQTPQVFSGSLIKEAYGILYENENQNGITDDAMVVESMLQQPVKLFEGSYENIKITTPDDLVIAEKILEKTENNVLT